VGALATGRGRVEMDQLDEVYFGERVGKKKIYQYGQKAFYERCLQQNSAVSDSTGLRIYAGAQVFIRLMERYGELFNQKRVCELGCGIGAVGLCCCLLCSPRSILLTDGSPDAVALAEKNILEFGVSDIATSQQLFWSESGCEECPRFDVVIGCELMYYKLEMALLFSTVRNLLDPSLGLFLHAHIFRKDGQDNEFYSLLTAHGWRTLEIDVSVIVSEEELSEHADWTNVRCLVSGPSGVIEEFHARYRDWQPFTGEREAVEAVNPLAGLNVF
jgi:2-polyprenyl-3-methyl-5-hydroxy-6-metoxy-1,4-benzoquinol methylase